MRRNLILVYPPRLSTTYTGDVSLAILYLAGAARDCGVCDSIKIFDFNAPVGIGKTMNDLNALVSSLQGDTVVAINCLYSALFPNVREIAVNLKRCTQKNLKIIIGGMHPTIFAKKIIENCPEVDAVAVGEFDTELPKLLRYLFNNGNFNDLESCCLRVNSQPVLIPRKNYVQDLDTLPHPGYEFFNFEEYSVDTTNWWSPDGIKISPFFLPLLTSRSCPNRCNFCSMWLVMGDKYRVRSIRSVFEEIRFLYDTYGVNYFKIMDDNFSLDRERTLQLCKMIIESNIKVYFDALNGLSIKTLDEEVIYMLRRAGLIMAGIAVESGSDYIRNKIMGKNITREQIISVAKMCSSVGINVSAFIIIGMPEDTEDTLKETVEIIQEIDAARISLLLAKPFPGTELFEQCVRDGLFVDEINQDLLWNGEADKMNAKYTGTFLKRVSNYHDRAHFMIKPYNLTLERLTELEIEIQKLAYSKSKAWIERVKENHT